MTSSAFHSIVSTYYPSMPPSLRPTPIPPEIVDAFREVAPTIEGFAREQDLLIERYRRGKAAWELRFGRRMGGIAAITISYRERTGHVLDVSATWWLDDREQQSRRLQSKKIAVFDRRAGGPVLRDQLTLALTTIDRWTIDDLGPPRGPFRTWSTEEPTTNLPLR